MKTFAITLSLTGKITVPERVIRDLRIAATDSPAEGGDRFLHELGKAQPDDDLFIQAALKNALRNIARNGITQDIAAMGVGIKAAPAVVTVSVPEHIVTQIKALEQVPVSDITVNNAEGAFNPLSSEPIA